MSPRGEGGLTLSMRRAGGVGNGAARLGCSQVRRGRAEPSPAVRGIPCGIPVGVVLVRWVVSVSRVVRSVPVEPSGLLDVTLVMRRSGVRLPKAAPHLCPLSRPNAEFYIHLSRCCRSLSTSEKATGSNVAVALPSRPGRFVRVCPVHRSRFRVGSSSNRQRAGQRRIEPGTDLHGDQLGRLPRRRDPYAAIIQCERRPWSGSTVRDHRRR
jgi:hypothetical protein